MHIHGRVLYFKNAESGVPKSLVVVKIELEYADFVRAHATSGLAYLYHPGCIFIPDVASVKFLGVGAIRIRANDTPFLTYEIAAGDLTSSQARQGSRA